MRDFLADTNTAMRRILPGDAQHSLVVMALDQIRNQGGIIYITSQVLIEFQSIATRPIASNGLGMTPENASLQAQQLEQIFPFLPDTPTIYRHWRTLVDNYGVQVRQVHDARLAAVMLAHRVPNLLTFNTTHFTRFAEIHVFSPADILTP